MDRLHILFKKVGTDIFNNRLWLLTHRLVSLWLINLLQCANNSNYPHKPTRARAQRYRRTRDLRQI